MNSLIQNPDFDLMEALAQLEHDQWLHWSQTVAAQVDEATRKKWQGSWVPYSALPEAMKEVDRFWARQVTGLLRERKLIP